jgi:hypothetical protein
VIPRGCWRWLAFRWVLAAVAAAWPVGAHAQERIIGLLSLPEVFGNDVCDRFTPSEVPLHATPGSTPHIGSIRVDRYWTFQSDLSCEGLRVGVHRTGTDRVGELPTREFGYEVPGAIVVDARALGRDRWFKVRLDTGSAWLRASERDTYYPLEMLISSELAYVTEAFRGGRLSRIAGAAGQVTAAIDSSPQPVRVREFRRMNNRLWLRVEVLSHSFCEGGAMPKVTARGWLPAHDPSGEPTVWFPSRGC